MATASLAASESPDTGDIAAHRAVWAGFLAFLQWSSLLASLIIAYLVLVVAIGMNWLLALFLLAVFGYAAGRAMAMGTAWNVTLAGACMCAVIVRIVIGLVGALI